MSADGLARPDPEEVLATLKDFQRASVEHAFGRMFAEHEPSKRFLVADEVGLGKTMVARGLIAKTIQHLWDDVERIDVVYICSNGAIAAQNIRKLNVMVDQDFSFSSRMTLIAEQIQALRRRKVNFVSFTPGTSFDLKSAMGTARERVLLRVMLGMHLGSEVLDTRGARELLRGGVKDVTRFDQICRNSGIFPAAIDPQLADDFGQQLSSTALDNEFRELAGKLGESPRDPHLLWERNRVIGKLRDNLARHCVRALEPDLVILDEFQRFKHLLDGDSDASRLARDVFDYEDNRTLLLSATPYKMYTIAEEVAAGDDHYADFLATTAFLLGDRQADFADALRRFQAVFLDISKVGIAEVREARSEVERYLRDVMVRTERGSALRGSRDGVNPFEAPVDTPMLREVQTKVDGLTPADIKSFVELDGLARTLGSPSVLEYWKSAPYFLNFSDGYKLGRQIDAALEDLEQGPELAEKIKEATSTQLPWADWSKYEPVESDNPKLRDLTDKTVGRGAWETMWLAPSLPYYQLGGPWAEPSLENFTKRLVFSAWAAAPTSIASLVSYDAERRMITQPSADQTDEEASKPRIRNSTEGRRKIGALLQYRRNTDGQPASMSTFALVYPSPTLARLGDPLALARATGGPQTLDQVLDQVEADLVDALSELPTQNREGRVDERWYWAAPLMLDSRADAAPWMGHKRQYLSSWGNNAGDDPAGAETEGEQSGDGAFGEHVDVAAQAYRGELDLGRQPEDLAAMLALLAVASPANVAWRTLTTVLDPNDLDWAWTGACRIATGMRGLFNLPEVRTMVQGRYAGDYWRAVLGYCADGCLGAVMDEFVHVLHESMGMHVADNHNQFMMLADEVAAALAIKAPAYSATEHVTDGGPTRHRLRSRFALRFGDGSAETDASTIRASNVRTAFNSPFWPFVLATTSVGQEGLDFHLYCHAITHWNLPVNPVDLEQREGRVHRYKGHAIRKNVAAKHSDAAWAGKGDPWKNMFEDAVENRPAEANDLIPFWTYNGPASIERHVPAFPLSREVRHLVDLKRSAALYRLVLGQPHGEDVVEHLAKHASKEVLAELRINLASEIRAEDARTWAQAAAEQRKLESQRALRYAKAPTEE